MTSRPLPVVSGRECIDAFVRLGYLEMRTKGSHVRLRCEGRAPLTIPLHRELDRGLLRALIRAAGITVDQFLELRK
jgi:predicted RNA binding protein YcfA (HicA-like mRNA interferase family)